MSDSITLEKPTLDAERELAADKAQLAPALQQEVDQAQAKFKDVDSAMKSVPFTASETLEVQDKVKAHLEALGRVDIYSGSTQDISDAFAELFSKAKERHDATANLASRFTEQKFTNGRNPEGFKAVKAMADALQKYNPANYNMVEPTGMVKYFPKFVKQGLSHYLLQFKEAQTSINQLMDGVQDVVEDGKKAISELHILDDKFITLAKELRIEYETFTLVGEKVEEYLVDLRETDPLKADKVQTALMHRIAEARLDARTTMLHAINGSMLISSLQATQQMVITAAERASTTGRLILTINQTVAASASEQSDQRELLESVNKIIGDMTESTSVMMKDHIKKMKDLAGASLGPAEKLKAAFIMNAESFAEMNKISAIATKSINLNIQSLDSLHKEAILRLQAEQAAATAFEGIVKNAQNVAQAPTQAPSAQSFGPR